MFWIHYTSAFHLKRSIVLQVVFFVFIVLTSNPNLNGRTHQDDGRFVHVASTKKKTPENIEQYP